MVFGRNEEQNEKMCYVQKNDNSAFLMFGVISLCKN